MASNQTAEQKRRQAHFAKITGENLDTIHTEACRVFPTRNHLLDSLPKGGVAAEVGVAYGKFSSEIMRRMRPEKLHLIDLWDGDRYGGGRKAVEDAFELPISEGRVEIHQGMSLEILREFPDRHFDFIYIDTAHSYDLTLAELELAEQKIKDGGFIGGHDFTAGNVVAPYVYGVIQAANKFCRDRGWRHKYLSIETGTYFSFCLERIPMQQQPSG